MCYWGAFAHRLKSAGSPNSLGHYATRTTLDGAVNYFSWPWPVKGVGSLWRAVAKKVSLSLFTVNGIRKL